VDTASSQPGDIVLPLESAAFAAGSVEAAADLCNAIHESLPEEIIEELWLTAEGNSNGITREEFSSILARVGSKCNHGLPSDIHPNTSQQIAFYRALRLTELILAQACALGREVAWQRFLTLYRASITQAAIAVTRSAALGNDLADSLYSELFGLKEREGLRVSPLASYSGRGSLLAWLRTTLAQRHIDHHRRTHRETSLGEMDLAETSTAAPALSTEISLLGRAVERTLEALEAEERFLLSSYYLDRRTLIEIARVLKVHEATVSRRLNRLVAGMRKQLLKNLRLAGMRKGEAEEALGADPRDIEINLRSLLQISQPAAFTVQTKQMGPDSR
jgi:RNA polymerase sigma-70 factor (ECF subfamily)